MGYGRIRGGHRASGARGGTGRAGSFKHKLIKRLKAGEVGVSSNRLENRGFVRFFRLIGEVRAWNVEKLNHYIAMQTKTSEIAKTKSLYEINLEDFGIQKLLGKGTLAFPVTVTVQRATDQAKKKIEAAGGKCIELKPKMEKKPEKKDEMKAAKKKSKKKTEEEEQNSGE
jgi:ribosomal protein L15